MIAQGRILSAEQQRRILRGPAAVYLLVANADGRIDSLEEASFAEQLLRLGAGPGDVAGIFQELRDNLRATLSPLQQGGPRPAAYLAEAVCDSIRQVDLDFGLDTGKAFRGALRQLGLGVARASGGFLNLFGDKVSDEERQALGELDRLLGAE
ncbi:MAG: hypothetical protein RL095_2697 [Verrucomicrobiota bacterium]|jgi:hypothetical protein